MKKISAFQLQVAVEDMYYNIYKNTVKTEKKFYGENILDIDSHFTFAEDIVLCLMSDNPKQEIDLYINKMLNRFCKGCIQAYYEMLLSVSLMGTVFYDCEMLDLSKCCVQWFAKLAYDEDFYHKYISDENIERFWTLR